MLPTLDSHSSAGVVKGSSAPAYKHSLTLQAELRWRIRRTWLSVCTHSQLHTSPVCMCECVCVCVCGSRVALTTCCRFSFRLPLEPRADSHQRRSRNRNRGRTENDIVTGLFISPLEWTTPTALPPAFTCRAANVGWSCWYVYREGREERVLICELHVLRRKWLNR